MTKQEFMTLCESGYLEVAQLDEIKDFYEYEKQFEKIRYSGLAQRLIFITDGAVWIKNWLEDAYPQATQLPNWYPAIKHLSEFARQYFNCEDQRKHWIEQQKQLLYESQIQEVLSNNIALPAKKSTIKGAKNKLLQQQRLHGLQKVSKHGCRTDGFRSNRISSQDSNTKKNETLCSEMDKEKSTKYAGAQVYQNEW